jgi:hypothetical protein
MPTNDPDGDQGERDRRDPALAAALDHAGGHPDEGNATGQLARKIKTTPDAVVGRRAAGTDIASGQPQREYGNRHVHPEQRAPSERLGQDATEQRATAAGDTTDRAPDADGACPGQTIRISSLDEREARRHE